MRDCQREYRLIVPQRACSLRASLSTVNNNGYAFWDGTSMATPHVAGTVALVQSAAAQPLSPAEIEQLLKDAARPLPGSCSGGCGAGIVDAKAAVDAVAGGGDPDPDPDPQTPTAGFDYSKDGLSVSFTSTSSDSDGTIASYSWDFGDGTGSTQANPTKTYAAAGSYTVKLTVTDNDGGSDDETKTVSVSADVPGGGTLENGVPVTGLAGAKNALLRYTLEVPAGATDLKFVTSGGSGDPDLYVKFGSEPTTSSYNCRSTTPGTNESCTINNVQAGTYHVLVHAWSAINGVSLTGSYNTDGGGDDDDDGDRQTYSNGNNVWIFDRTWVDSVVNVWGRSGNAPSNASVNVDIKHTYRGEVRIDLIAPDGSSYRLKDTNNDSGDNINATYSVNLSSERLNGMWRLRVTDTDWNDSGYIDNWSITF